MDLGEVGQMEERLYIRHYIGFRNEASGKHMLVMRLRQTIHRRKVNLRHDVVWVGN